jgi:predicted transposase YbfD/YdcC
VLIQIACTATSTEIAAVPTLLTLLCLQDCTVAMNEMNTQRALAQQIVDQGRGLRHGPQGQSRDAA